MPSRQRIHIVVGRGFSPETGPDLWVQGAYGTLKRATAEKDRLTDAVEQGDLSRIEQLDPAYNDASIDLSYEATTLKIQTGDIEDS